MSVRSCFASTAVLGFLGKILTTGLLVSSNISRTMTSLTANDATKFTVSYVTTPNDTVAKFLARGLVQRQFAACINIVPSITSIYRWKDKIEETSEVLLIIKSRASRLDELTKFIKDNHPDEICEVISTSIIQGNPLYLDWLGEAVPDVPTTTVKKEKS